MRKELKKHYKQMKPQELVSVVNMVGRALVGIDRSNLKISGHCAERMGKRLGVISNDILIDVLKHCEIIEYKQIFDGAYLIDKRVVLRSTKEYDNYNYCIVFSIVNRCVITYWKNKTTYTHENVDLSKYQENMKVY